MADYDISYVDHLYLPVAVEVNDGTIGYNGTPMDPETFQSKLKSFAAQYWPYTKLSAPSLHNFVKLPGGYNLFMLPLDYHGVSPSKIGLNVVTAKWANAEKMRCLEARG